MAKQVKVSNKKPGERIFYASQTMGEHLNDTATYGDRVFLAWNENGGVTEMTYAEFSAKAHAFATGLTERFGTMANKKIAVMGETSAKWVIAYKAIIASGNVVVPMDKELAPEEIAKFLDLAGVSAVVYSSTYKTLYEGIAAEKKDLLLIPMDGTETEEGKWPFDAVIAAGESAPALCEYDTDRERCCQLLFTSGTTGTSKCVMLCQRNIFACANAACQSVDFNKDDVIVSVLPLHHTYELTCTYIAGPAYGMKICINDSIRHAAQNFKKFQPTALVLVPLFVTTLYKKILAEAKKSGKDKVLPIAARVAGVLRRGGIDLSETLFKDVRNAFGGRVEKIVCGGAALNPELIRTFDAFGMAIYEGYGITECSPLVAVTPYYARKPGSVGPDVTCCQSRIDGTIQDENGHITGEIQVKGDNVMMGYMNNDEANAAAFTEDGWYRTGDVGYKDKDGYIHITGRMKSVIVLDNGKNVFPEEIEEYLEEVEMIAESVVVGREEEDGTKLVAVIVPAYDKYPEMDDTAFRTEIQKQIAALNKKLPSYKQIHKLDFRKTEFEKTTSKKIKRHLVK